MFSATVPAPILNGIEPRLLEAERPNSNLNSWRFCFAAFKQDDLLDEDLALHLGFFLASWGMMRGSSFLRRFDHRVHLPVVEILRSNKARMLRESSKSATTKIADVLEIRDAIAEAYAAFGRDGETINVSDTLASKIMLATLGCVPAYDRYFVAGARARSIPGRFNENSLNAIWRHVEERASEYEHARLSVERRLKCEIPLMRIVDMHFFTIGATGG